VASEVKSLAVQTAKATEEIAGQIATRRHLQFRDQARLKAPDPYRPIREADIVSSSTFICQPSINRHLQFPLVHLSRDQNCSVFEPKMGFD
jgi:hypothetical protein